MLGEMTSRARMKQYLKQTLYLEDQCTHLTSKYWLDAKPDPDSKSRRKKPCIKDPSKVIKYRTLLPLAKIAPRWLTDRSTSAGGEAAVLISLLVQLPPALERIKEAGLGWAAHQSAVVCHPYLLSLAVASKYHGNYQEQGVALGAALGSFSWLHQAAVKFPLISVMSETEHLASSREFYIND